MNRREAIKTSCESIVKVIPSFFGLTSGLSEILTASDSLAVEESPACFPKRIALPNAPDTTQLSDIAAPRAED